MEESRFSEEKVAYALKQAALRTTVGETCRRLGTAEVTIYVWRK